MNPADLPFPLKGVHLGAEYELQPALTAAGGSNVRAEDALGRRLRGGSRPGQARYVDGRVGGIDGPVQHLNYIVDPTTAALLTKFEQDTPVGDTVPDPSTNNAAGGDTDPGNPDVRNPNREVPDGGSGVPPNRDVGLDPPGGGGGDDEGWVYVQSAAANFDLVTAGARTDEVALPAEVVRHRLLVVGVYADVREQSGAAGPAPAVTVTDSLGNVYAAAAENFLAADAVPSMSPYGVFVGLYWCRSEFGGACAARVTVTPGAGQNAGTTSVFAAEYRGLQVTTPLEADAEGSGYNTTDPVLQETGVLAVGGTDRLVVALFGWNRNGAGSTVAPVPAGAGDGVNDYLVREAVDSSLPGEAIFFDDVSSASAVGAVSVLREYPSEPSWPADFHTKWIGVAASFRYQ